MSPRRTPSTGDDDVRRATEDLAQLLTDWGIPRMSSRVLMHLMTAPTGRMSAAELAAALTASPAAISGAVRYLEHTTLIRRTRDPGTRHDVFALIDDGWYAASAMKTEMFTRFAELSERAADAIEARGDQPPAAAARVREMGDYFTFVGDEVVGLLGRWEARRSGPS